MRYFRLGVGWGRGGLLGVCLLATFAWQSLPTFSPDGTPPGSREWLPSAQAVGHISSISDVLPPELGGVTFAPQTVAKGRGFYIFFSNKAPSDFQPQQYFHPNSLRRRQKHGLPLVDATDLPVKPAYVAAVEAQVDSLRHVLRWFNAVSVWARPEQIAAVARLPFVERVQAFAHSSGGQLARENKQSLALPKDAPKLDTLLSLTRALIQADRLDQAGLSGAGVIMAVFDAGFRETDTHPALAYTREQGNILRTYDFYRGKEEVYTHSRHGTEVLSVVSGMYKGRALGCGKDVQFLLARTEHERKELPVEEDHWLAAAEWADRHGADIISSSITFTHERYAYEDMDGETALVSQAARMATQKGMLVINAMGNEAERPWTYLGAPADVPEVLSVGGSMPMMPVHIKFSSLGPNARGVQKPNLAAPAYLVTAWKRGRFAVNAGTSFATPLVAGLAACLMQQQPEATAQAIFQRLERAGHYHPYYDYHLGYGVVQAEKLLADSLPPSPPTFALSQRADSVILQFDEALMADSSDHPNGRPIYLHLQPEFGPLKAQFFEILPNSTRAYFFQRDSATEGTLRIWFAGYLHEESLHPLR